MLALPLAPDRTGGPVASDLVSGCTVLYCVVLLLRTRRSPLSRTAAVLLGLPVAGLALAAMNAPSPGAGITGLVRYMQVFVLVPAAVLLLIRNRGDFRLVAWSLVALGMWQGAVGVHQYVSGTGASYQGETIRAVGTFGPQDVMGMATVVSLGVVCAVGLALGSARHRMVAVSCALTLLLPLALSFSRGAWIATLVTCSVQLVLAGVRRTLKTCVVLAAVCTVLAGVPGAGTAVLEERIDSITRVTATPDQSVVDRYAMWEAAMAIWREHPLAGTGLKAFPEHRDGHAPPGLSSGSDVGGAGTSYRKQPLLSPHNMYLLVLSEQGLIGLLACTGSWLGLAVLGMRRLLRARGAPGGVSDCALVACGLLVWQLTEFLYSDIGGPSTVLTGVCFGLAAWWALAASDGAPALPSPPREAVRGAVAPCR
ncbi:O-antigen ligase family protein [Streptomyces cellulosae]